MSHRNTSLHTETALFAHKYPCSRGKRRQICRRIHTNRTEKETVLLKNGQQSFQAAAAATAMEVAVSVQQSQPHGASPAVLGTREASQLLMQNEHLSHSASSQSSKTHSAVALSLQVGARTKCEWIECTKAVLFLATDCSCQRDTR